MAYEESRWYSSDHIERNYSEIALLLRLVNIDWPASGLAGPFGVPSRFGL